MTFDIVIVLYNSAKWLPNCIKALEKTNYDKAKLTLIFVDNASSDDTVKTIRAMQQNCTEFGNFIVSESNSNGGFSKGCNAGAALGNAPYIFFLNADTEVFPDIFTQLSKAIESADEAVAAFECRQLPFETGHNINPVTLDTTWASGAALVIKRTAFEAIGGFDEHLFMYCEDVDISWRLRASGYRIQYVPKAEVLHYAYEGNELPEQKLGEYAGSYLGNLLLRYKFGSLKEIMQGNKMYLRTLRYPQHFPRVRKVMAKNYIRHFAMLWPFLFWRFRNKALFKQKTYQFDGGFSPDRGLTRLNKHNNSIFISIVIRTCGRPLVLEKTLKSLCNQTYTNFEVVVVEDGAPISEQMAKQFEDRLTIHYFATGEKVGRSKAGNLGLSKTKGEYLNFLDDDDYFYPDHLECMAAFIAENPAVDLVTAASMAVEADVLSKEPYQVDIKRIYPVRFEKIDVFNLCQQCQMPIQSIVFKRWLFETYGGLNEKLDGDEDWSMWLKYFSVAKRGNSKGLDITRATSAFMVPANAEAAKRRETEYQQYEQQMLDDESIQFTVTPRQMREFYQGMVADMNHLYNQGKLEEFFLKNKEKNDTTKS